MYHSESMLSLEHMLNDIDKSYPEGACIGTSEYDALLQVQQLEEWHQWYIIHYPHTNPQDLVDLYGKDIDIRILFLAEPEPTYSLMLCVQAFHEIDKVFCNNRSELPRSISKWHMPRNMTAYGYLLSDEVMAWWRRELIKLNAELLAGSPSRILTQLRLCKIRNILLQVEEILEKACPQRWTGGPRVANKPWGQSRNGNFVLPDGVLRSIYERQQLLAMSLKSRVRCDGASQPLSEDRAWRSKESEDEVR